VAGAPIFLIPPSPPSPCSYKQLQTVVCTENYTRIYQVTESAKLAQ
jgi:hypothetical protein